VERIPGRCLIQKSPTVPNLRLETPFHIICATGALYLLPKKILTKENFQLKTRNGVTAAVMALKAPNADLLPYEVVGLISQNAPEFDL
jgi:hypothetical protein